MKATLFLLLSLLLLGMQGLAWARDAVLPAGTLLECTLDEPNFSSATASVGDPLLCHPRPMSSFGQSVFPRGTYIVGHLAADKDPGHFVGKGWMKIRFDRIGLPSTDLPFSGKIIAVNGYKVDREGKILGKGHAKRDIAEWMFPPLWPWKVLSLPARGPRPTLKGEVSLTLRLMDDVVVPDAGTWQRFGSGRSGSLITPGFLDRHGEMAPTSLMPDQPAAQPEAKPEIPRVSLISTKAGSADESSLSQPLPVAAQAEWRRFNADAKTQPLQVSPQLTLFALKQGAVYAVSDYRRNDDRLDYVLASGESGEIALNEVDWSATARLNSERHVRVTLRDAQ